MVSTLQSKKIPTQNKEEPVVIFLPQFDPRFSPIPVAACRGSRDSRSPWEGAELLLGHLEVSAHVPPNTAKVQPSQQSTLLTLEWREGLDQSGIRSFLPSQLTEASPQTSDLPVLGTSQSKRKKHVLAHATFFL